MQLDGFAAGCLRPRIAARWVSASSTNQDPADLAGFSRPCPGHAQRTTACEVVYVPGDDQQRPTRRVEEQLGHGRYGPGAFDEVTVPPNDERREVQERDLDDPADVAVDLDELRDGGPTVSPGVATTTGGKAGPASVHRRAGRPGARGKVAPSTTGDATSGGMRTRSGGPTSDASGGASQVGNFTER